MPITGTTAIVMLNDDMITFFSEFFLIPPRLPSSFTRITTPALAAVIFVPFFIVKSSAALSLCESEPKYP
jgi:hypothetical protein